MGQNLDLSVEELINQHPSSVFGHFPHSRHAVFPEVFRNLHRIGSSTFSQVISHDPHV
jgi:hypothetical protein